MTPYRAPVSSWPRASRGARSRKTSPLCTDRVHERRNVCDGDAVLGIVRQCSRLFRQRASPGPVGALDQSLANGIGPVHPGRHQQIKSAFGLRIEPDRDGAFCDGNSGLVSMRGVNAFQLALPEGVPLGNRAAELAFRKLEELVTRLACVLPYYN